MKKLTRHKLAFTIALIITLILLGGTGYLLYSLSLLTGIENILRIIVSIVLVIIFIVLLLLGIRFLNK